MNTHHHLAIVDPAIKTPETDSFNFFVEKSRLPCAYHLPALCGPATLACEDLNRLAGVIILGSGASVNDESSWQLALRNWLTVVIDRDIPVLGICFGHQLLAHLQGGEVGYLHESRKKETGLRTIDLAQSSLFHASRGEVAVTHNEVVKRVPDSMRVIASSSVVSVEGLEHVSKPVFSFQAHPEATPTFLAANGLADLVPINRLEFGHELVARFLHLVHDRLK
jgi:GMP synthase (glutamine-hydrolysing)